MSAIEKIIKEQRGFVGYLTAGDGGIARSKEAMLALIRGGVNVLEVGVPFSDPVADGPTIQAAAMRSLGAGTRLEDVFQLIREIKHETEIPIILFTYFNPILNVGSEFYHRAKAAGVDGCLVVDLPIEEAAEHLKQCAEADIDPVLLISPTSSKERIETICELSRGMIYYVTRSGTTGVRDDLPNDLKDRLRLIKSISKVPVVAGFGISNRDMASTMLGYADGFVVGSLFVKAVADGATPEQITELVKEIDPR